MRHNRSPAIVTTISLRTVRKIRLRIWVDAAGWFHTCGKSSTSANSIMLVIMKAHAAVRGANFRSAPRAVPPPPGVHFHRRSSSPATSRLSGSMASYCRRACRLFVARLLQCQFHFVAAVPHRPAHDRRSVGVLPRSPAVKDRMRHFRAETAAINAHIAEGNAVLIAEVANLNIADVTGALTLIVV